MAMRVLIVDDEALARERLRGLVGDIEGYVVAGEAAHGAEALELCGREAPDIVLLDIRMPHIDGLEVARHLAALERPPAVIFTTAYEDHALEAFSTHAVDYLLKPVRGERLRNALRAAQTLTRAQAQALHSEGAGGRRGHLLARGRNRLELIPVDEIFYLRAEHKYLLVRHAGGEALIEESLKELEREHGERFMRVHRNALIAVDRLAGLERGAGGRTYARLRGLDERLEVSRRHAPAVRRFLERRPAEGPGPA